MTTCSTDKSNHGKENVKNNDAFSATAPQCLSAASNKYSLVQNDHKPLTATPKLPFANSGREAVSVPHDQCEMDQLSSKLKEKIEAETKNIEEFIDKTVTETVSGIVEFKNDLMRECEIRSGLRKRSSLAATVSDVVSGATGKTCVDESAAFLKKEIEVINAVVQQANVLPAVLSNGHAK